MRIINLFFLILCSLASNGQTTWNLTWSEEFVGTQLDTSHWNFEIGTGNSGWGNNELQYYTASSQNLFLQNGFAHFVARAQPFGTSNYTSARITTSEKFNLTYGRLEARIKIPNGNGLWPAFWLLGQNINSVSWPACGEIDIMEHVSNSPNIHGTAHWNNNGHQSSGGTASMNDNDFHLYTIQWDSLYIQWYLDGLPYFTLPITSPTFDAFHQPFFIILNLAVGGNWPGSPDATTPFPSEMLVDYVRYYQPEITDNITSQTISQLSYQYSDNSLVIQCAEELHGEYSFVDMTGKTIQAGKINNGACLSISGTNAGIYLLQVRSNNICKVYKICIP